MVLSCFADPAVRAASKYIGSNARQGVAGDDGELGDVFLM